MNKELKNKLIELQAMPRLERIKKTNEFLEVKPGPLRELSPWWWWKWSCRVSVLIVVDGLDYNPLDGFGLTEFVKIFEEIQNQSLTNIEYRVTLAHTSDLSGGDPTYDINNDIRMFASYSFIHQRIHQFDFASSVNLNTFDQVWIFGVGSSGSISSNEISAINNYMNNGGGLFATGDHGSLGKRLCGNIDRVKDMRLWDSTSSNNDSDEVSMTGRRRNDTNRPGAGQAVSTAFENQSDDIPQNIAVRTFGNGLPHPLLSIPTSIRPSGIIDIMPDHPHEGECTNERFFTVTNPVTNNSESIRSQIIATSFVLGGSTSGGKSPTDPHCFPSISVFDGRPANVGRIVVDSTWHHFVNINLDGTGSGGQTGLNNSDFEVIKKYFKNIATWISRRKFMLCWFKFIWAELINNSQLIESSLNEPELPFEKIQPDDLYSIGKLAQEIISNKLSPSFAYEFMCEMIRPVNPDIADDLNIWKPKFKGDRSDQNAFNRWLDMDKMIGIAVGSGFIALRDNLERIQNEKEDSFDKIDNIFFEGVDKGFQLSLKLMDRDMGRFKRTMKKGISNRTLK